jgi:UDP-N-acetylmuramate--alanine ligase
MKDQFIDTFARHLRPEDELLMPEPVYFGGTTDRSVSSIDIVRGVETRGRNAHVFADRAACGDWLVATARPGDRIIVMGARDDTLSQFGADVLQRLAQ